LNIDPKVLIDRVRQVTKDVIKKSPYNHLGIILLSSMKRAFLMLKSKALIMAVFEISAI